MLKFEWRNNMRHSTMLSGTWLVETANILSRNLKTEKKLIWNRINGISNVTTFLTITSDFRALSANKNVTMTVWNRLPTKDGKISRNIAVQILLTFLLKIWMQNSLFSILQALRTSLHLLTDRMILSAILMVQDVSVVTAIAP